MTDQEADAEAIRHPHMSAEVHAYYAGRGSIGDRGEVWYENQFTRAELIAAFNRGVREVKAEARLNQDTEWDSD